MAKSNTFRALAYRILMVRPHAYLILKVPRWGKYSFMLHILNETWNAIWNPSIYNIIRWFAGPMGQTTCQPSVWYYYYFFIKSCKILWKNHLNLFSYKITKMKINSFECSKSIRNYEKKTTWNVRCLVDMSFVPSAQRTSVLYCRLTDLRTGYMQHVCMLLTPNTTLNLESGTT